MISDKMVQSLNNQMNKEYYSAFFYLSMAAYAENIGYKGSAKWFKIQYHEENYHAIKIYEFLQTRGGKITFLDIEKPEQDFTSLQDLFKKSIEHEEIVTELINNLMDVAIEKKDHASQIFLQWFVTEQVEEEENVNDIITQLKLVGNDVTGLLNLDKELGARVLNAPIDFSNGLPKM